MRRSLFVSVAFHLAILLLAAAGLPASRPDVAPMPDSALSVELVDVAEKSNLPPAPSPKMEVKPEEKPKPPEQARAPEPVKREQPPPPPPPSPPPAAKAEPAPKAAPAKAAPPPEPAPVAEPAPAPTFAPKRKAEAPPRPVDEADKVAQAEAKKAEPKTEAKSEPKPEPKPAKPEPAKVPEPAKPKADTAKPKPDAEMDFAAVLKSLETKRQAAPGEPSRGESRTGSDAANASGKNPSDSYDASLPVTMSEIDGVRRQIEQCWNLPAGARDAPDLRVTIVVDMNADGTPRSAVIDDQGQMQANPYYRVAAESALRAVLNPRCHPFKLPRDKYERWKSMTLIFDPKDMFGT